jgi:hypothetical protein
MNTDELCEKIQLPSELKKRVSLTDRTGFASFSSRFCRADEYDRAYGEWKEKYEKEDRDGIIALALMLDGACKTYADYEKKKIPQEIFVDTMKCFTRFCGEFYVSYAHYGFDRAFWTGRQLSMRLFRVGALEYELCDGEGKKEISVHIPSDADLREEAVRRSLKAAHEFFAAYYPDYDGVEYHCTSWLLSPALTPFLPPDSHIRKFAAMFAIKDVYPDDESYKEWLFKNRDIRIQDAPENTSLQRAVKRFVWGGGKIGEAHGIISV